MLNFNCRAAAKRSPAGYPHVQNATLPAGMRVYAVGDGHGQRKKFDQLIHIIHHDLATTGEGVTDPRLILLGDNVNKGNDTRGILDSIADERDRNKLRLSYVHGNHERWMDEVLTQTPQHGWLQAGAWINRYGGDATLKSYGMTNLRKRLDNVHNYAELHAEMHERIPPRHKALLKSTVAHVVLGDFRFSHMGVNPAYALNAQNGASDMRQNTDIAESFLGFKGLLEQVFVHGHYITKEPEVAPHRIGVDTGAHKGGPLTAVVLDGGVPGANRRFLQAGLK